MSKKKLLVIALVMLLGALLLIGCRGGKADYLYIAEERKTDFKIVCYLEDNSAAREFMADLVIKTGTTFGLSSPEKAGDSAFYVGTPEKMAGIGGTDTNLTYTQYEILVADGNIYVCVGAEEIAEDVLMMLKDKIVKVENGTFGIDKNTHIRGNLSEISEIVPVFQTEAGKALPLHHSGRSSYQVVYTGMSVGDAPDEIAAYRALLESYGYTLYQENEIGNNTFFTYYKGDTQINGNYYQAMRQFRLVFGPKCDLPVNAPITGHQKVATPSVAIIGMSENVLCMVLQLEDGSFVVIDGGWDSDQPQTKTLNAGDRNERVVEYYRSSTKDMQTLFEYMAQRAPSGKPQVTWMITHADPDHILMPPKFFEKYHDYVDVNMAIYNFPDFTNIGLGESGGSTNDPMIMTSYAENFLYALDKYYPDAQHYVYHAGMKMYMPGAELEFLFSHEDQWPNAMPWMNHTSGVWRFHIADKTVMITGDAEKGLCNQMVGVYGNYLQSDILQVCHHGANGATLPFYKNVDPMLCFWPCQQYHLDYDNRQTGVKSGYEFNQFLRLSKKVIAHLSNTETHTVYLPSMEIE